MKRRTSFTLITLSTLSFATSVTTLVVVMVGAKKIEHELQEVKVKTNNTVNKLKAAINNLDA